jgi:putative transposase
MRQYKRREQSYESDLTERQWETIAPLFVGMREYTWPKRELVNAVLYFVKTGCQWRNMPHDFPPYSTVHSFYRRARINGLWDKILQYLVVKTRENAGRRAEPSYGIIDSQSVKTVSASEERGIDGGKKRKVGNGILL